MKTIDFLFIFMLIVPFSVPKEQQTTEIYEISYGEILDLQIQVMEKNIQELSEEIYKNLNYEKGRPNKNNILRQAKRKEVKNH